MPATPFRILTLAMCGLLFACSNAPLHGRRTVIPTADEVPNGTPHTNSPAVHTVTVGRAPGLPSPIAPGNLGLPAVLPAEPGLAAAPATVTTIAGSGVAHFADGPGTRAAFDTPTGLAIAPDGSLLVADHNNHAIRRIDLLDPSHPVTTFAGGASGGADAAGFADGDLKTARFRGPMGLAVGSDGAIYVADGSNHRIRKIADGKVTTIAGTADGGPQDGPGLRAGFQLPTALVLDGKGGLIVTDSVDNRVRRINLNAADHPVVTLAGNGEQSAHDGVGAGASFSAPFGLVMDPLGNALIADPGNRRVRRVAPDGTVKSLLAGATGGLVPFQPSGIVLRADGTIVVSDVGNHRILAIPPANANTTPDTRVLAGHTQGHSDGIGEAASFDDPEGLVLAPDGAIYVADTQNNQIRKLVFGTATATSAASGAATPGTTATSAATPIQTASHNP
jgi:serine/threonine-protein kinase